MSKELKKYIGTLQTRIANQRAEIARLHKEIETLTIQCNAWHLAAERVGEELQVARANAETLDIYLKDYKSRNKELQKANERLAKWCEELEAELNAAGVSVGEWEVTSDEYEICADEFVCSVCKESFVTSELTDEEFLKMMKFCPHCGAKMKGE